MKTITFYNDKINQEFPILQKKVFSKFGQKIEQIKIENWVTHGKHIDDFLETIKDENEIIVLFDIDSIPLNHQIIPKAVKWSQENIGIYSMAQTAKNLNYPIIHAAPAFMVFSIKSYNHLGRPSFTTNKKMGYNISFKEDILELNGWERQDDTYYEIVGGCQLELV